MSNHSLCHQRCDQKKMISNMETHQCQRHHPQSLILNGDMFCSVSYVSKYLFTEYISINIHPFHRLCSVVGGRNFPHKVASVALHKSYTESWWRHQMETFSALLPLYVGNSPVAGEFPRKGQRRGALMLSLICPLINSWVNNREAGDLKRHRAHYEVIVMMIWTCRWIHTHITTQNWLYNYT